MIDKLEIGQDRKWNDLNYGEFVGLYVGDSRCVLREKGE